MKFEPRRHCRAAGRCCWLWEKMQVWFGLTGWRNGQHRASWPQVRLWEVPPGSSSEEWRNRWLCCFFPARPPRPLTLAAAPPFSLEDHSSYSIHELGGDDFSLAPPWPIRALLLLFDLRDQVRDEDVIQGPEGTALLLLGWREAWERWLLLSQFS